MSSKRLWTHLQAAILFVLFSGIENSVLHIIWARGLSAHSSLKNHFFIFLLVLHLKLYMVFSGDK